MEISLSPIMMEGSDKKGLMDFEQFTRLASDVGYHGICMRASLAGVQTPRAERLERKRELDRLGLRPTMVTANFDVPLNNDNGPKALRDIGPHLDVADDFDCKLLRVCIKSWADLKWVQRAADEALERGITLTHMAHGQSMFETVDGSIEYVRRVNRRSFALTYETTNWVWCLRMSGARPSSASLPTCATSTSRTPRCGSRARSGCCAGTPDGSTTTMRPSASPTP